MGEASGCQSQSLDSPKGLGADSGHIQSEAFSSLLSLILLAQSLGLCNGCSGILDRALSDGLGFRDSLFQHVQFFLLARMSPDLASISRDSVVETILYF